MRLAYLGCILLIEVEMYLFWSYHELRYIEVLFMLLVMCFCFIIIMTTFFYTNTYSHRYLYNISDISFISYFQWIIIWMSVYLNNSDLYWLLVMENRVIKISCSIPIILEFLCSILIIVLFFLFALYWSFKIYLP